MTTHDSKFCVLCLSGGHTPSETPPPSDLPASPTPGSNDGADLRDQIAEAIWTGQASASAPAWELVLTYSEFAGYRADARQRADAVMAVVQPALDAKDARIAELEARVERFKKQRAGWSGISDLRAEANEYEAERDRLREAVVPLLNAQEAMLQGWAESSDEHRQELWRTLHERADYVRGTLDQPAKDDR